MADNKDCILDFNWRDYIKLEPDFPDEETRKFWADFDLSLSPEVEPQVIEALDQLASTEDGQKLIMEAYKQNGNHKIGIYDFSEEGIDPSFTPYGTKVKYGPKGSVRPNGINIDSESVEKFVYLDTSDDPHPLPLQHVLVHELNHAADGELYSLVEKWNSLVKAQERFFALSEYSWMPDIVIDYLQSNLSKQRSEYNKESLLVEEKTTQLTNDFMAKYYNAAPQKEYHAVELDADITPGILDVLELPSAQCTIPNVLPNTPDNTQNRLR